MFDGGRPMGGYGAAYTEAPQTPTTWGTLVPGGPAAPAAWPTPTWTAPTDAGGGGWGQPSWPSARTELFDKEKDPVPTWDGKEPARNLRPYLRALQFWRHDTATPPVRQGAKLYKSLTVGSDLRAAAELIDDATILSERGFDAIVNAIKEAYTVYEELDTELIVEEAIYGSERQKGESFLAYTARKLPKLRTLENTLSTKLPTNLTGVILKRRANLTETQRATLHTWSRGNVSLDVVAAHL